MRVVLSVLATVLCSLLGATSLTEAEVSEELGRGFLPSGAAESSLTVVFEEVVQADMAADRRLLNLSSAEEYDVYRSALKAKMTEAIGGLPERTPLNTRSFGLFNRLGYSVEKVLFESMPGVYVSGLFHKPTSARGRLPTVVIACGHSAAGKNFFGYQRACVQLARRGIASFIYDPYDQGDRLQHPGFGGMAGHNAIGVRAMLLGWSMAKLRIWDAIRAIDYVISRDDVDGGKIGFQGQSGGGTLTVLTTALDDRIKASAPSCYLTNMRELAMHCGPQDAEQNIFGQLAFGLNHAAYVLMSGCPVMLVCRKDDFFPYYGSCHTYDVVVQVARTLGRMDRYLLFAQPGFHGWIESTREASAIWMQRWLAGGAEVPDASILRLKDFAVSGEMADCGLAQSESAVPPTGQVRDMKGFRSVYRVLRDELAICETNRARARGERVSAETVRHVARIRLPEAMKCQVKTVSSTNRNGVVVERLAFAYANGLAIPGVLLVPADGRNGEPVLVVGNDGRKCVAPIACRYLGDGHPTLVVDYTASGEIACLKHPFYGSKHPEEEVAHLLGWIGDTLVGRRATDLLVAAAELRRRFGRRPVLAASGDAVVPAVHADAASPEMFADVTLSQLPLSWTEMVCDDLPHDFYNCVNGALREYDWTELIRK